MENYNSNYLTQERADKVQASAFSVLMQNVYKWMAAGLAMTAFTALIVAKSSLVYTLMSNSVLFWGLAIAEIVLVLVMSVRIMKMSFMTAGLVFAAYAILNGVTLSFIFLAYTAESIATTFFVTAGTFGGMSLLGYFIKKDLSGLGRILYMLLIGLILATIVNIFVHSSGLAMLLNYAGVIIFVGLTAYDTQKIKKMMIDLGEEGVTDQTNKLALLGSLTLYLDFINLFLYLLRFLGDRR